MVSKWLHLIKTRNYCLAREYNFRLGDFICCLDYVMNYADYRLQAQLRVWKWKCYFSNDATPMCRKTVFKKKCCFWFFIISSLRLSIRVSKVVKYHDSLLSQWSKWVNSGDIFFWYQLLLSRQKLGTFLENKMLQKLKFKNLLLNPKGCGGSPAISHRIILWSQKFLTLSINILTWR